MKVFLSYKFTGEDPERLEENIMRVCNALKNKGYSVRCTFYDNADYLEKGFNHRQIMEHALSYLDECDLVLAFVDSHEKSEGMLLEAGYVIAKGKRLVLAIRKGIDRYFLRAMADRVVEFDSLEDLEHELNERNL